MIYACDTHSCLWYFTFIAIPSFVYPKLACTDLLISLHDHRHLFADGLVTVRPIATKFRWDKENVSCLQFKKFHFNPTNFNRKLTMMFKLDLKKKNPTLTAFRTHVQNGLIQKVNIFCTENEHLGAVSIRKTVLPAMAIPMLKIRRPNGRLIFNMEIAIRR